MPNTFAYLALFSWPVVVFFFYRRLPRAQALIASMLGGYLLLPNAVGINPPVLPTLDKTFIPAAAALVMSLLVPAPPERPSVLRRAAESREGRGGGTRQRAPVPARRSVAPRPRDRVQSRPHQSRIGTALLALLFVTPFVTVMTNPEPIHFGPRILRGLQIYDAFSIGLGALTSVLPYLLARRYLASPDAHRLLLKGLVLWGLFYTVPALFEIRLSPQLSRWVYGFFAGQFAGTMRDGGFRPAVFLQQGLWLAIFFTMTILASTALWRMARAERNPQAGRWLLALAWLLGTLFLSHSLGALVIAILALPIILFVPVRGQMIVMSALAAVILTYPALRGADLIPVDQVVSLAKDISTDRAYSLEFRLRNEDQLLKRARLKPLAGWGGWGRARVYNPVTGRDESITDGAWIIIVGDSGWMGYIACFGLLSAPIFLLTLRRRLEPDFATAGLAVVLVANLTDMIPNGTLTPVTWLVAGALMGRVALPPLARSENSPTRSA